MKSVKRRLFWILAMLIGIPLIWFISIVWMTDPPIITGQVIRDIEYKPGLTLDVYTPTKATKGATPVVLYIHGGAWIIGSKEALNFNRFNEAINNLRDSGYSIVSIDYTLASTEQPPFPICLEDASDALAWVIKEAESRGWDIQNIGLFGESAGAHIAMMLAYAGPETFNQTCSNVPLRYVLDIYGPNQLEGIFRMPAAESYYSFLEQLPTPISSRIDLAQSIFGFDPEQDTLRAQRYMALYSPIRYCNEMAPPTLIIQGDQDHLVPVDQSIALHHLLDSLQVENQMLILPDVDHGFIGATTDQKKEVQHLITEFILRHRFLH